MGTARRLVTFIGAAVMVSALAAVPLAPAAVAAPKTTITVGSFSGFEYLPTCSNTPPFPCGQTALNLRFRIYTSRFFQEDITVDWQIFGGTATAGQDYSGPTTGTVTIAAHTINNEVLIPLVNDGFGEPDETFQVRVTGASVPANLSSVGTQTIRDGSRIPGDCSLSKNATNHTAMTCTDRPAGQRWYLYVHCFYPLGDPAIRGNDVIGNGTSEGTCGLGQTQTFGTLFRTY